MGSTLWTVTFDHVSGLSEDRVVNTFSWTYPGLSPVDPENVFDMLEDFYTASPDPDSGAISTFLGSTLAGTATVRGYDRADPTPRVPFFTDTFSFTPNDDSLPEEVALCVSFKGDSVSGVDPARQRGRVYIGPLSVDTLVTTTGRPGAGVLLSLAHGARDLLAASDAALNWTWVVHSSVGAGLDTQITSGWVDNAYDTQRRRGPAATARTLWTATTPA